MTGLSYVGFTKQEIEQRWKNHIDLALTTEVNYHFQNAIRKYGVNNWSLKLLESQDFGSKAEAEEREKFWIKHEGTFTTGYNMTAGGSGGDLLSKFSTKERNEFGSKISNSLKNMNPEKKSEWIQKVKDSWERKTQEEKDFINDKRAKSCLKAFSEHKDRFLEKRKIAFDAKTDAELDEIKTKISEGRKKYFSKMTAEDKEAFGEKIRKRMVRKCKTPNGEYESIDDASNNEGIPKSTIYRWMKNQKDGYKLL